MRHTLLLRLVGPMQAWGVQSRFTVRDTLTEPTKSGVVGLVCAALGRDRADDISDLAQLRMGVRVDREGVVRRDYHTAGREGFLRASGGVEAKDVVPSDRFYLADAWFTVGLEGDPALLQRLDAALAAPHWPLALGRKAFPPSLPVHVLLPDGRPALFDLPVAEALVAFADHPGVAPPPPPPEGWRVVLDGEAVTDAITVVARRMQTDHPLSFAPRRFAPREVVVGTLQPAPADVPQ